MAPASTAKSSVASRAIASSSPRAGGDACDSCGISRANAAMITSSTTVTRRISTRRAYITMPGVRPPSLRRSYVDRATGCADAGDLVRRIRAARIVRRIAVVQRAVEVVVLAPAVSDDEVGTLRVHDQLVWRGRRALGRHHLHDVARERARRLRHQRSGARHAIEPVVDVRGDEELAAEVLDRKS